MSIENLQPFQMTVIELPKGGGLFWVARCSVCGDPIIPGEEREGLKGGIAVWFPQTKEAFAAHRCCDRFNQDFQRRGIDLWFDLKDLIKMDQRSKVQRFFDGESLDSAFRDSPPRRRRKGVSA